LDSATGRFYFLEMNTRLQVEHPITEETTAVDLVHAQIAIAAGERLAWSQEQLTRRGHAIEVRVYAEDPAQGHLPQAGPLLLYREPVMPGVRVDSGVVEGTEISVHYDPLIAKVVARAETREDARRRALSALRNFPVLGIRTNVPFLIALLEHPRFIAGELDTRLVDTEHDALIAAIPGEPTDEARAVAAELRTRNPATTSLIPDPRSPISDPWSSLRNWRV
jgi:acetyl/propionyl-CoA carboxylase alpha subunit